MSKDRVTGLIALTLGIVVAISANRLPPSNMAGDIGPALFPYICAFVLIVCGVGLTVKDKADSGEPYFTRKQFLRVTFFLGCILLYIIALSLFGYFLPTFVFLFVLNRLFAPKVKEGIVNAIVFDVLLTASIYFIFTKVFALVLPRGSLL